MKASKGKFALFRIASRIPARWLVGVVMFDSGNGTGTGCLGLLARRGKRDSLNMYVYSAMQVDCTKGQKSGHLIILWQMPHS